MKFSIITVNYNNGPGLERTIRSVISQKGISDYEYIVIDGNSTDKSVEIIRQYANRIDYWVTEPDAGIYNAMNKGVNAAKGHYCIFMNSGDCFYNEKVLQSVLKCIDFDADFVVGNYCIGSNVRKAPERVTAMTLFTTIDKSVCHQALFTKRKVLLQNPFQEEYSIVADFVNQFHSLIFDNARYQYINVTICDVEPGGISAQSYQKLTDEKDLYFRRTLPPRIYEDYKTFMSIKLIETRYNELYTLLGKYNFSVRDLKITTAVLRLIGFLKDIKIKIYSFIHA